MAHAEGKITIARPVKEVFGKIGLNRKTRGQAWQIRTYRSRDRSYRPEAAGGTGTKA